MKEFDRIDGIDGIDPLGWGDDCPAQGVDPVKKLRLDTDQAMVAKEDTVAVEVKGKVYLVGAGPGDPGLFTLRGREVMEQAEVVIYDYLANEDLLSYAPATAEQIYVGKKGGDHTLSQDGINDLIVAKGRDHLVVRLKGGDPFVFGRGGEEAERLVAAGRAARGSAVYFAAALLPPLAIDLVTYLARRHAERPFEGVVSLPELLHALHLPHAALVEAVVATTVEVVIEGSGARLASHRVRIDGSQAALRDRLLALLGVTPFAPPTASEAATVLGVAMAELEPLLAHLGRTGEVMRIGADRYYLPAAIVEVERQVRTHLAGHPSLTVAEFKALFALTRRHAIPLLEHLDRTGITRRDGEVRRAVERRG